MRVKSSVYTRQRKKKAFRISKGYYSNKNNRWRMAIQQVEKSLRYAYRDRKDKKRNFREAWITRINAASNELGLAYSRLIHGLKASNVEINRKMLSDLAVRDPEAFNEIAAIAKSALTAPSR
jgi:large subunit ribosomal protein L20